MELPSTSTDVLFFVRVSWRFQTPVQCGLATVPFPARISAVAVTRWSGPANCWSWPMAVSRPTSAFCLAMATFCWLLAALVSTLRTMLRLTRMSIRKATRTTVRTIENAWVDFRVAISARAPPIGNRSP
ncbi:MAG: hypothetical protein WCS65_02095 [Verrucomicrobiae bacterium]